MLTLLADLTPASAVFGAISAGAALAVPYFLLVDARVPRPDVWLLVESGRFDRLLIAIADARFEPRHAKPSRFNALKGATR
ncbi:hypothetical protein [Streptomyces cupreus]|uniref:Uncharacterized protein n=1 Tax=Streptomyces cupreus TaxID=2759956 RepID=A0A7X1MC14_9ACTN|nr:hypothetical protein [Streptomyces cupreus]MBC2903205.1 hypothetical protein [Streptomyces cupreus]